MKFKKLWEEDHVNIKVSIPYMRFYGEPKLTKPKELKGIKQLTSIDFIPNKCKCKIFVKDNDVWILHRDFFSEVVSEHDYKFRKKFIYNDTFGCVVLRNEAYICIENLMNHTNNRKIVSCILRQLEQILHFNEYELEPSEWERFFEKVVGELKND